MFLWFISVISLKFRCWNMGIMTENEITFSCEMTLYVLQVECSVMLTIVWFVVYHTYLSAFNMSVLFFCGCVSGYQAYQSREQNGWDWICHDWTWDNCISTTTWFGKTEWTSFGNRTEEAAARQWQSKRVHDICEGQSFDFLLSVQLNKGILEWNQNVKY